MVSHNTAQEKGVFRKKGLKTGKWYDIIIMLHNIIYLNSISVGFCLLAKTHASFPMLIEGLILCSDKWSYAFFGVWFRL